MADAPVVGLFLCDECFRGRHPQMLITCRTCRRPNQLGYVWNECRACRAKKGLCAKCGRQRFTPGCGKRRRRPSQLV